VAGSRDVAGSRYGAGQRHVGGSRYAARSRHGAGSWQHEAADRSRDARGRAVTRPGRAWAGVAALLVDGNNLLHAVAGNAGPASLRGLLPRVVAAVPLEVDAVLVLDGPPDPGAPSRARVRRGLAIRHAGRVSADALIVQLVEARPFPERAEVLVITNDVALADQVRHVGGRTRPVRWLEERLDEPAITRAPGASIGGPRPGRILRRPAATTDPRGMGDGGTDAERDAERPAWAPGRGATRKRGNPRRGH
jgi:hypothetical protein